jgi:hypothetical protein
LELRYVSLRYDKHKNLTFCVFILLKSMDNYNKEIAQLRDRLVTPHYSLFWSGCKPVCCYLPPV